MGIEYSNEENSDRRKGAMRLLDRLIVSSESFVANCNQFALLQGCHDIINGCHHLLLKLNNLDRPPPSRLPEADCPEYPEWPE